VELVAAVRRRNIAHALYPRRFLGQLNFSSSQRNVSGVF